MKIIVGLGNPGKEYDITRHNTGWLYLEHLEQNFNFKIDEKKCDSLIKQIYINNEKVVFAKPQTFMNLSGHAVQKLKNWYKVENNDILVIFDDIDIPFGEFRYKKSGSGGTHNGMKSVVQMLGTKDIPRIRIGLGNLKHERQDMIDFVLQKFSKEQLKVLDEVFEKIDTRFEEFIDGNI